MEKFLKAVTLTGIYGGLLMPLAYYSEVIFPFVFPKVIYFQTLIGLTFPAYLTLAFSNPEYRPKPHPIYLALIAYFAAITVSTIFAIDPFRSFWGNQERMSGLFTLLHFFAWLLMASALLKDWISWRRLLNFHVTVSAIVSLSAIWQMYSGIVNETMLSDIRASGLLGNPIFLGTYQAITMLLTGLILLHSKRFVEKALYISAGTLSLVAFLGTQSRGPFLGFAAGLLIFLALYISLTKRTRLRIFILFSLICSFLVYTLILVFKDTPFISHSPFHRLTNFTNILSENRLVIWKTAWRAFLERPFFGWGYDNFHILYDKNYHQEALKYGWLDVWIDRSHNILLDLLSTTGLFGFIAYLCIFIMAIYSIKKAYERRSISLSTLCLLVSIYGAYFVQNLFFFEHPTSILMFFLTIGITTNITHKTTDKDKHEIKPNINLIYKLIPIFTVFIAVTYYASIRPFYVSQLTFKANNSFGTPSGLIIANDASFIWTPYFYDQLILPYDNFTATIKTKNLNNIVNFPEWYRLTELAMEKEIGHHPNDAHSHYLYARFLTVMLQIGLVEPSQVEHQYLLALQSANPKRAIILYPLADFYFHTGKQQKALQIYKYVVDLDPKNSFAKSKYNELLEQLPNGA